MKAGFLEDVTPPPAVPAAELEAEEREKRQVVRSLRAELRALREAAAINDWKGCTRDTGEHRAYRSSLDRSPR
mgnify:CR=1 FL=1